MSAEKEEEFKPKIRTEGWWIFAKIWFEIDEIYENPAKTDSPLRKDSWIAEGKLHENDITIPPALMHIIGVKEGEKIYLKIYGTQTPFEANAIRPPDELIGGDDEADTPDCFITIGAALRERVGLKKLPETRKTKKFKNKYGPPVFVRRK